MQDGGDFTVMRERFTALVKAQRKTVRPVIEIPDIGSFVHANFYFPASLKLEKVPDAVPLVSATFGETPGSAPRSRSPEQVDLTSEQGSAILSWGKGGTIYQAGARSSPQLASSQRGASQQTTAQQAAPKPAHARAQAQLGNSGLLADYIAHHNGSAPEVRLPSVRQTQPPLRDQLQSGLDRARQPSHLRQQEQQVRGQVQHAAGGTPRPTLLPVTSMGGHHVVGQQVHQITPQQRQHQQTDYERVQEERARQQLRMMQAKFRTTPSSQLPPPYSAPPQFAVQPAPTRPAPASVRPVASAQATALLLQRPGLVSQGLIAGTSTQPLPKRVYRAEEIVNGVPFETLDNQPVEFLQAMLKDIVRRQKREDGPCLEEYGPQKLTPKKRKRSKAPAAGECAVEKEETDDTDGTESESLEVGSTAVDAVDVDKLFGPDSEEDTDSDSNIGEPEGQSPKPSPSPSKATKERRPLQMAVAAAARDSEQAKTREREEREKQKEREKERKKAKARAKAAAASAAKKQKTAEGQSPASPPAISPPRQDGAKAKTSKGSLMPARQKQHSAPQKSPPRSAATVSGEESQLAKDLRTLLNIVRRRNGETDVDRLTPEHLVTYLGPLLGLSTGHRFLTLPTILTVILGYVRGRGWLTFNNGLLPACETLRNAMRTFMEKQ